MRMLGKIKLRYQIFIITLFLVGISSITTAVIMKEQQKQMLDVYEMDSYQLLNAQEKNLSIQIREIENVIFGLCLNDEFQGALLDYLKSGKKKPTTLESASVEKFLNSAVLNRSDIRNIWLHTSKGDFYRIQYGVKSDFSFEDTQIAKLIKDTPQQSLWWGTSQVNELYPSQAGTVIPLVFRHDLKYAYSTEAEIIDIIVLVNENTIYQSLNRDMGEGQRLLLMNRDGELVFSGNRELEAVLGSALKSAMSDLSGGMDPKTKTITYQGEEYLFSFTEVEAASWYLICLTEEERVFGGMQQLFATSRILLMAITIVAFIVSWLLSRRISVPLEELAMTCQRVGNGERSLRYKDSGQPEIRLLGEHFNTMLNQIDNLIHELEEQKEWARIEQLLKRRAELKALQSQINPHFLYNTLESICWKAVDAGCDEISDMTQSLAIMLRTGLSQGKEIVPLETEIKNAVSYLEIQKIRYEELFEYEILMDKELKEYFCVKLVVQPLVENAIYHGLKEHMEQQGLIRIVVEDKGEFLEIDVQDNGNGFTEEKLQQVNEQLRKRILMENGSYGIYNINERLKLYFGENYGLCYRASEGYTHTVLKFPKVVREEIENYVQYY